MLAITTIPQHAASARLDNVPEPHADEHTGRERLGMAFVRKPDDVKVVIDFTS